MSTMTTLADTMKQLQNEGFVDHFQIQRGTLVALEAGRCFKPEDLSVEQQHRFEGTSDPADESLLLALSSQDGSVRGTLCTTFGPNLDRDEVRALQNLGA